MIAIDWTTMKAAEQLEVERLETLAVAAIAERNRRLAATDFYMLRDAPAAPEGVAEYRQALRDITDQPGFPETVEWPKLPEGVDAKY